MTRRLAAAVVCAVGAVGLAGAQTAQQAEAAQAQAQSEQIPVYRPGRDTGVSWPQLVEQQRPSYTRDAMQAQIQGVVVVEAVVLPDGRVGDVEVVKSLDREHGLDAQAVAAAKGWRFEPARLEATGEAVATRVTIELEFRMHDTNDPAARELPASTEPARLPRELNLPSFGSQQSLEEFERGAYREGTEGVVAPTVRRDVRPTYTPEAMRQKIQGIVAVDLVVNPDGTVARARLAGSLDPAYGLDDAALRAARQWQFEPGTGTLNGVAVPVIVRVRLEFRLH